MEPGRRSEMLQALDEMENSGRLLGRSIVIFGHSHASEALVDALAARGYAVCAILDNNPAKQGAVYRGVPLMAPEGVRAFSQSDVLVLVVSRFFAAMQAQLRTLGYAGEVLSLAVYDSFAEYTVAARVLARRQARVRRGAATLAQIRAQWPQQHLVVCPHGALGDVYLAMAFLPAYRAQHRLGPAVAVTVQGGCQAVARLFGQEAVALAPHAMDELVQALLFTGAGNCIIAHHDLPYTDRIIRYLDHHMLGFDDYYRQAVYALPAGTAPAAPMHSEAFTPKAGLQPGNTVLLAPYAKSVVSLPTAFWQALADGHRRQGHCVATLVFGDEAPLPGTLPLCLPIAQMIPAAEYAGHFIGIRSGLCDVLRSARCEKTVVFPSCYYSTTPVKVDTFFHMDGWENIVYPGL
ncbi:MAG: nucleoside-diphosphate sugar epimerase/dehydratase [Oscillospiraceae bacterium]